MITNNFKEPGYYIIKNMLNQNLWKHQIIEDSQQVDFDSVYQMSLKDGTKCTVILLPVYDVDWIWYQDVSSFTQEEIKKLFDYADDRLYDGTLFHHIDYDKVESISSILIGEN